MTAALLLCPHLALGRHRRARADRPGAGIIPPGSHGDKPDRYLLGTTRAYRTLYLPAPFKTVHTYLYGPDGRLRPAADTR